jgi:hypothetical protein
VTGAILSEARIRKDAVPAAWVMLAVVFTAALVIRLACFTGLIASDDSGYARYAQQNRSGDRRYNPRCGALRLLLVV